MSLVPSSARTATWICSILCALVFAAPDAQQPSATQVNPQFRAAVNLVRVDVYPTTKDGPVLDLQKNDFEVYEDGVLQRVETFEHIVAQPLVPENERSEPRSQEAMNDAAADPRARLFVVFFDTLHTVGYKRSDDLTKINYDPRSAGRDLTTFLNKTIGTDDLVAVMSPEMSLDSLRFTRRPSSFDEFLNSAAGWQKRFLDALADDKERLYDTCYAAPEERWIFWAMVERRREMRLLDALRGLVVWLDALREGRKAVLVVSEGWDLFRPDNNLSSPRRGQPPLPPTIGGRPGGMPQMAGRSGAEHSRDECENDRLMLARLDNDRDFRRLVDQANRAGVSFYSIDPRGLTFEGTMNRRSDSLISLATATDGVAITDTNSFTPALNRIHDDLASYYLLGYYTSNAKTDGTYRKIEVRVKRPGIEVRSRPGYRALTAAEHAEFANVKDAKAAVDPADDARERALRLLDDMQSAQPLHVAGGYAWASGGDAGGTPHPVLWVVGELDEAVARLPEWSDDRTVSLSVSDSRGTVVTTAAAALSSSQRSFAVYLVDTALDEGGEYVVKVHAKGRTGSAEDVMTQIKMAVPRASGTVPILGSAMLSRGGASLKQPFLPTTGRSFRRTERIRVALPLGPQVDGVSAQLLDRRGHALPVQLAFTIREEGRLRLAYGELAMAPLARGDYLIACEIVSGQAHGHTFIAFRVVS